jgi:hypothetical protein
VPQPHTEDQIAGVEQGVPPLGRVS